MYQAVLTVRKFQKNTQDNGDRKEGSARSYILEYIGTVNLAGNGIAGPQKCDI